MVAGKSCASCPSFLNSADATKVFKKNIGVPMCGTYGFPLGVPAQAENSGPRNRAIVKSFAEDCDSYGKPMPPFPKQYNTEIMLPHPEAKSGTEPEGADNVGSCLNCYNFIGPATVENALGYTGVGLCGAKGRLIFPTRYSTEADGCSDAHALWRHAGSRPRLAQGLDALDIEEMFLLPVYSDSFSKVIDPVKAFLEKKAAGIVDPQDYESDFPVTESDRAAGIRAWRRITDPYGAGPDTMLPIYSESLFTDTERLKIPRTGDDEHPELYVDHGGFTYKVAVCWRELDETPALWGKAGTGKTELFRHLAWLMAIPFERISITESTELDDIAGKMMYTPEKGTYFQYGRIPKAWTKPCVLCVDEPNVGPPAVWQFLRPLTDNSKQLVVDSSDDAKPISRHDDCYLGLAMNPAYDPLNVGTNQIGDADASRLMSIKMELPPERLEAEIISARVQLDGWEIEKQDLDKIMRIAKDIRALTEEGTLQMSWGIRHNIKVARASRWFDLETTYRVAAADYLEPEAAQYLLDIVRAHQ